jgi:MoaA/NifB/PqqE/SkfB family radical SAM enzyme
MIAADRASSDFALEPPKIISMTMTSRCNLRCVMCDHGIRNVKKEDFQADLFDLAGDFIANASLVDLTGLGEPMLSDLFWKILGKFPAVTQPDEEKFFLTFNSNGTLLNERNVERVLQSRVRKVRISIDSPDPELFRRIRGTELAPIVEGLRHLIRRRNAMGRHYPQVSVEMTLMRANLDGVCKMIDLAAEVGVDFLEVWSLNHVADASLPTWQVKKDDWTFDYAEQMIDGLPRPEIDAAVARFFEHAATRNLPLFTRILGENRTSDALLDDFAELFGGAPNVHWNSDSIRCGMPWKELRVTYDGDVFACCWGPKPIGSLRTQTLETIWNNVAMREMRSDLINGVIPDLCAGAACDHIGGRMKTAAGWRTDPGLGMVLELSDAPIFYEPSAGLYGLENYLGRPLRWTNGAAEFHVTVPIGSEHPSLFVKIWNIGPSSVEISLNGEKVLCGELSPDGIAEQVDLQRFSAGTTLSIRVESASFTPEGDARQLGVAIKSIRLVCPAQSNSVLGRDGAAAAPQQRFL